MRRYTEREWKGQERKGQERKGREREGQERKGQEREGQEREGQEREGQERKGQEREGQEREGQEREGQERKGQERKGREWEEQERKGQKWKGREWKEALRMALEAPAPLRKRAFLRGLGRTRISNWQFMLQQLFFIRKWVWALSLVLSAVALVGGRVLNKDVLWLLSAMMPFLALSSVAENIRAEVFGMAELEMAARFSHKSVVLARMGILGAAHFGILCLVSLLGHPGGGSLFQTGMYLLTPYLLTDTGSLWLARRVRGKEAVYGGFGLTVLISLAPILTRQVNLLPYSAGNYHWRLAAFLLLCAAAVSEWKKQIERMEELTWN